MHTDLHGSILTFIFNFYYHYPEGWRNADKSLENSPASEYFLNQYQIVNQIEPVCPQLCLSLCPSEKNILLVANIIRKYCN